MRNILNFPRIYNVFSKVIRSDARSVYVEKYVRVKEGDKILDIGCGTADILLNLPRVDYYGLDVNQAYIEHAQKRFAGHGVFLTAQIDKDIIRKYSLSDFDIALATGVVHHLNDNEALALFEVAKAALKPGGRLITLDGCYMKNQSRISRFILCKDRGKYVRTKDEYLNLASTYFKRIQVSIHHDLLRIPYTHIIMECAA
jgi:cyclopropane fatty-acyl-phospholipid synthase-like methyltransferase